MEFSTQDVYGIEVDAIIALAKLQKEFAAFDSEPIADDVLPARFADAGAKLAVFVSEHLTGINAAAAITLGAAARVQFAATEAGLRELAETSPRTALEAGVAFLKQGAQTIALVNRANAIADAALG